MHQEQTAINSEILSDYQYTRSIRFRAEIAQKSSKLPHPPSKNAIDKDDQLLKCIEEAKKIHNEMMCLWFPNTSEKKDKITTEISVNKSWLKLYLNQKFYSLNKRGKGNSYLLCDLDFFREEANDWLHRWENLLKELQGFTQAPEEQLYRRSEIAGCLQTFLSKRYFPWIESFLSNAKHKNDSDSLRKKQESVGELGETLKSLELEYLPHQNGGLLVAQGSMNYYTVNKKTKGYQEREKKEKNKLEKDIYSCIKTGSGNYQWKRKNEETGFFTFKSPQEKNWAEHYFNNKSWGVEEISLTLEKTYDAMKAFKAEQKALFYEVIKHSVTSPHTSYTFKNENFVLGRKGIQISFEPEQMKKGEKFFKENFSLFKFKGKVNKRSYDDFIGLERKIEDSIKEKNRLQSQGKDGLLSTKNKDNLQDILDKIKKYKKEKGKYLFGEKCYFSEYGNFSGEYKSVATNLGKAKASIKGIEKERKDSENNKYWSVIWEEANPNKPESPYRYLWLIPKDTGSEKDTLQVAREFITDPTKNSEVGDDPAGKLYYFESLTKRALHKLCFAEEGSFLKEMEKIDSSLYCKAKEVRELKTVCKNKDEEERKKSEKAQKTLEYLQSVLKSDYAKERLQLSNFNLDNVLKATSLNEFELELEQACYFVGKRFLSEKEKHEFLQRWNVISLKITSYDLEFRHQKNQPASEERRHTKLWNNFWLNCEKPNSLHPTRLNPEWKVRYRSKDELFAEYWKKNKWGEAGITNRRLNDQYTLQFSFAINGGKKYPELAFARPEDITKEIKGFNDKLKPKDGLNSLWRYGIDRGNIELATLCLVKFDSTQKYEHNGKEFLRPIFPNKDEKAIRCRELKSDFLDHEDYRTPRLKEAGRKSKIIDNLSYFIEKKDWFENQDNWFDEKDFACIDLTTAKLISGQIILNGDVRTYLKLKKENAKRKIYNLFHQEGEQIQDLHWVNVDGGLLVPSHYNKEEIKALKKNKHKLASLQIYFYSEKFTPLLAKECEEDAKKYPGHFQQYGDLSQKCDNEKAKLWIRHSLQNYLNGLKKLEEHRKLEKPLTKEQAKANLHTPAIDKLNNLRDAITANMVGVITHLQKYYPGLIILEDLEKSTVDEHFYQHNENISRRLELSLYQKLQGEGKVPPHLKDIIELRESTRKTDEELSFQLGYMVFVDKTDTSNACPYCGKNWKGENKVLKFEKHQFLCGKHDEECGFDTKNITEDKAFLAEINDPDKVAAYNVAKKVQSLVDRPDIPSAQEENNSTTKSDKQGKNGQKQKDKQARKNKSVESLSSQSQSEFSHKPFQNLDKIFQSSTPKPKK